jgi:hypothetical protein
MIYTIIVKIYFTASIAGKKLYLESYQQIVNLLHKPENEVAADHILNQSASQISLETREDRVAFQKQLESWINHADCMVVEATFPSISVGYEISLARQRGKTVLILYQEGDPPNILSDSDDERVVCERYTRETLAEIINGFLDYVKGKADSRFTFYITATQLAHLSNQAKAKRIPKAAYLRNIIDQDM